MVTLVVFYMCLDREKERYKNILLKKFSIKRRSFFLFDYYEQIIQIF